MDAATLPSWLQPLATLGWVDWVLLTVLLGSVVVGIARGFVFECMSLAGWVVAWFGAQWAAPELAAVLAPLMGRLGEPGSAAPHAAAFALAFVGVLLLWSLLARAVKLLLHATPLSAADRLLGGGFGVLRGAVLLLALATVVTLTPAAQSQAWRVSQGARWLGLSLQALKPLLPEQARQLLRG
jgi:membrane protein required for colicin V production